EDHYDPEMLDDGPHEPLTMATRLAAEREMEARDRREGRAGRSPLGHTADSPRRPAAAVETPFKKRLSDWNSSPVSGSRGGSDLDDTSTKKRKRPQNYDDEDGQDEDVHESQYDLNQERLTPGVEVEKRVADKIRLCFQQFLIKFVAEGQVVPKYPDALRKMAEEYQAHLEVSFHHLQQWSGPLAMWLYDSPRQILPLLNETLMLQAARKFKTYETMANVGENELRVAISGFPVKDTIRGLCSRHMNKLIQVKGVATKRTNVFNQVRRLWVRCAKCNFAIGPLDVAEETDLRPSKCLECQSKGPWRVDRQQTIYQNYQKITLQESPSAVDPGKMFIASMAPSIYGMWHVKTAIALSIMGGRQKEVAGKHRIRGDINTLIVGDPGLGKSQFLKYVEQIFPRAVYTTGKGASAVGLTAAVTRDETGQWCLEGGAMVLADDGMCLIDEFDKMNDQDRTSLHEAMEQQSISISKAGIVATLQARCAVVAVANPTEGRYDPQRTFSQNVNLSDPILSRFDLTCVLRDEADPVQDEMLADHV
ncbi:MCM2, partial [Symbiodinium necroappetens]